jgi:hypothetical protein
MSLSLRFLHALEVGRGRALIILAPLVVFVLVIAMTYDLVIYKGLPDADSMDTAQLARQIDLGGGFTTMIIRPHAVSQLSVLKAGRGEGDGLFPPAKFPSNAPRVLPDTYNPPLYPCLLAAWFKLTGPDFGENSLQMIAKHAYDPELVIPPLNQILLLATALTLFVLTLRLFDQRAAWLAVLCFLVGDFAWKFSLTALSTNLLMLLVTLALLAAVEIFRIGEELEEDRDRPAWPAWTWGLALGVLLGLIALTRLHFLVLLLPVAVFLYFMPRCPIVLPIIVVVLAVLVTVPWFLRVERVTGSLLGSNDDLLFNGEGEYRGNQVYRSLAIPATEMPFESAGIKEIKGFLWNFERGWDLLGSQPLTLFFVASLMHPFRRQRAHAYRWLLVGSGVTLVLINSLGVAQPDPLTAWNALAPLAPGILATGSAFFLVLLDRLALSLKLLSNTICVALVALTAIPMAGTIASRSSAYFHYPPYFPPYIQQLAELTHVDEWVTSDMPWATAWYGRRPSLWLPDTVSDFDQLHDNVCPTGLLIISPVTLGAPVMNLTSGEDHEWMFLLTATHLPPTFPLTAHATSPAGGPEYIIWSDTIRWATQH